MIEQTAAGLDLKFSLGEADIQHLAAQLNLPFNCWTQNPATDRRVRNFRRAKVPRRGHSLSILPGHHLAYA